jgi:hypothetical protein
MESTVLGPVAGELLVRCCFMALQSCQGCLKWQLVLVQVQVQV